MDLTCWVSESEGKHGSFLHVGLLIVNLEQIVLIKLAFDFPFALIETLLHLLDSLRALVVVVVKPTVLH